MTTPAPSIREQQAEATLLDRLRGIYRIPITDGLGPAGGEEPDNPNEFVRTYETPPIHREAAAYIQRLLDRLVAVEKTLEDERAMRASEVAATEQFIELMNAAIKEGSAAQKLITEEWKARALASESSSRELEEAREALRRIRDCIVEGTPGDLSAALLLADQAIYRSRPSRLAEGPVKVIIVARIPFDRDYDDGGSLVPPAEGREPVAKLGKRPSAFLVLAEERTLHFDEEQATAEADRLGVEYLGLYQRSREAGASLASNGDWRSEMDKLWSMFVAQCEAIEEYDTPHADSQHEIGFYSGQKNAAKRIRRSVEHPKYNPTDFPLYAHPLPVADGWRTPGTVPNEAVWAVRDSISRQTGWHVSELAIRSALEAVWPHEPDPEAVASFLDALEEWGCEDNGERAKAILSFIAGGCNLSAYEESLPTSPLTEQSHG